MAKLNSKPKEKDRAIPWSKGLPIFNTATGRYETPTRRKSASSGSATGAVVARGVSLGPRPAASASSNHPGSQRKMKRRFTEADSANSTSASQKRRRYIRQKNGGLADDFPTVLFPGVAMAIAVKKTEELKAEFPGVPLTVAIEIKRRETTAVEPHRQNPIRAPVVEAVGLPPRRQNPFKGPAETTTTTTKTAEPHRQNPTRGPVAKPTTTTTMTMTKTETKKVASKPRRQNPIKGPAEPKKSDKTPPPNSKVAVPATKTGSGFQRPVFNMAEFFGHGKKQARLPEKKGVVSASSSAGGRKRKAEEVEEDEKPAAMAMTMTKGPAVKKAKTAETAATPPKKRGPPATEPRTRSVRPKFDFAEFFGRRG